MGGLFNKTREMLQDGPFLKKALMIACPVALQGMLNTIVNMVDTLMIGGLGSTAIAAVGLANKVFFVFSLLVFGIVSGGGILAAQFWGNGDVKHWGHNICGSQPLPIHSLLLPMYMWQCFVPPISSCFR